MRCRKRFMEHQIGLDSPWQSTRGSRQLSASRLNPRRARAGAAAEGGAVRFQKVRKNCSYHINCPRRGDEYGHSGSEEARGRVAEAYGCAHGRR